MPAVLRGSNQRKPPVTSMVAPRNRALAGMASRKKKPKATGALTPESKTFKVFSSSQSISMNAGNVGRKNNTDTRMADAANESARIERRRRETRGRGGSS